MLLIPVEMATRAVRPPLKRLVCLVRGHEYEQQWHWLKLKLCRRCGKKEHV